MLVKNHIRVVRAERPIHRADGYGCGIGVVLDLVEQLGKIVAGLDGIRIEGPADRLVENRLVVEEAECLDRHGNAESLAVSGSRN